MGTLERIRKTSPYVLAVFALIFVGFMVASDADISNLMKQGKDYNTAVIAKVNGENIYLKEFNKRVEEQKEIDEYKKKQEGSDAQVDDTELRNKVFDQMILEILLKQESAKSGIYISDKEVNETLFENPPEQLRNFFVDSTGKVNPESYQRYLQILNNPDVLFDMLAQNKNMSEDDKKAYVANFRKDINRIIVQIKMKKMYDSYITLVNSAVTHASPAFANQIYMSENTLADAQYIMLNPNTIKNEEVTVNDDEIRKYYDSHKQYFKQKPKRKLRYAVFPRVPSAKDTARAIDSTMRVQEMLSKSTDINVRDSIFTKLFGRGDTTGFVATSSIDQRFLPLLLEASDKQIVGPISGADGSYFVRLDSRRTSTVVDSVQASHILIPFGQNKDSAKTFAERIKKEVKSGASFEAFAMQYSSDSGSGKKGGDVGYFKHGAMVKPFEEAAYAANKGEIVGPVESQFGFHIIKVVDKQSHEVAEMKISKVHIFPVMSEATIKDIAKDAAEFKKQLEGGASYDDLIKKFSSITGHDSVIVDKNKPVYINGRTTYFQSKYLTDLAFNRKVGTIFEPLELKRQAIIVAQVFAKMDDNISPLEEMKGFITQKLTTQKKLDLLKQKATEIYNQVRGLDSLNKAVIPGIEVKNAVGIKQFFGRGGEYDRDPVFTTKAFMLPVGQISEPIRGEFGYYIIQVTNKKDPDMKDVETQIPQFMMRLASWSASNYNNNWNNQQTEWTEKVQKSQWFELLKENSKIEDLRWDMNFQDY